jgi:hypothetical protein
MNLQQERIDGHNELVGDLEAAILDFEAVKASARKTASNAARRTAKLGKHRPTRKTLRKNRA